MAGAGSWCGVIKVGVEEGVLSAVLFRAEMKSPTALARGPLLLEDCVDVIHFAQPLEERDEVQQLGVRHVVEPRGHGHLNEGIMSNAVILHKNDTPVKCKKKKRKKKCNSKDITAVPNTHCVVGMEDVGGGGVVHNNDFVKVATQATQVLDVIPSVKDARLPEEAAAESAPLVQEVGYRVCILTEKRTRFKANG